jgi:hypothetical protein
MGLPDMRLPASNRRFAKIVVTLEHREDGGLRAYSEDVPGFVLSNPDPSVVLSDIAVALETILSSMWGVNVVAGPLVKPNGEDDDACRISEIPIPPREYAAYAL